MSIVIGEAAALFAFFRSLFLLSLDFFFLPCGGGGVSGATSAAASSVVSGYDGQIMDVSNWQWNVAWSLE